jgi:SET domain-containing protein
VQRSWIITLIKNYLAKSKIHGLGLFADENIKKGRIIWKFNPFIDILIPKKAMNQLPRVAQEFIMEYGWLSKISENYLICSDNDRFINHSSNPNLNIIVDEKEPEVMSIANRDISKGEEITVNYKDFDELSEKDKVNYLK